MGKFPHIANFILNPSPTVIEQFPTKNGVSTNGAILSSPEKIAQKRGRSLSMLLFFFIEHCHTKGF